MAFEWIYVLCGLTVGFVVGMTGVGGGSLMTPILLMFGIHPATAVGTDLLYAAVTKAGGVIVHHRKGHVDWHLVGWLSAGSVPFSLITLYVMSTIGVESGNVNHVIKMMLGVALMLTAAAIICKQKLIDFGKLHNAGFLHGHPGRLNVATWLTGCVLGVIVTITSIGAGALGTVALFLLFPFFQTTRLVGSEIAHAVPLTAIAGLGHLSLGSVNVPLLLNLLMGSLPGIYFGSHLSGGVPEKVLRPMLAIMLLIVGGKLVW